MKKGQEKAKVRAAEERAKGSPRATPRKSEQTARTEAFYTAIRVWYWKQVLAYEDHMTALGVPGLTERGSTACGLLEMHACRGRLQVDHVGTRNDKNPANLQSLCEAANMEKGSQKGKQWDLRSDEFQAWMVVARDRDWIWNALHQKWEAR